MPDKSRQESRRSYRDAVQRSLMLDPATALPDRGSSYRTTGDVLLNRDDLAFVGGLKQGIRDSCMQN